MRVLYADESNVFAMDGRAVVQVRRGSMTHEALDAVERQLPTVLAGGAATGLLVVMEPSAVVPPADVRSRQQDLVKRSLASSGMHVAIVILAEGVMGTLLRTVSRTMSIGHARTRTFGGIDESARWLGAHIGVEPGAITELATRARSLRG
jgi:hypothetical protein